MTGYNAVAVVAVSSRGITTLAQVNVVSCRWSWEKRGGSTLKGSLALKIINHRSHWSSCHKNNIQFVRSLWDLVRYGGYISLRTTYPLYDLETPCRMTEILQQQSVCTDGLIHATMKNSSPSELADLCKLGFWIPRHLLLSIYLINIKEKGFPFFVTTHMRREPWRDPMGLESALVALGYK